MNSAYLIRYGVMGHVGRFLADSDGYRRGQTVLIQSHRGTELGEILIPVAPEAPPVPSSPARVLRPAGDADLERARRAALDRPGRLAACTRALGEGSWPLQLIDV